MQQAGRGSALAPGVVTGAMTTFGGVFPSLPFLISAVHTPLVVAGIVVAIELVTISLTRKRFLSVSLRTSLLRVALGGALIFAAGVVLDSAWSPVDSAGLSEGGPMKTRASGPASA